MNPNCGRCQKTVYPTEKLSCLDKYWHKACFKCSVCNMTLNMKNYKGYNKEPYCNAHYPTTKHTAVADTPEMSRIAKNTAVQSQVKYHAAFEKSKGSKISVAEDPEVMRIKKNQDVISNVAYHGDMQKKMEQEAHRPRQAMEVPYTGQSYTITDQYVAGGAPRGYVSINEQPRRQPGNIANYDPMSKETVFANSPYSAQRTGTQVYTSAGASEPEPRTRRVGSIVDYDPVNEQFGSIAGQYSAEPEPEPVPAATPAPVYREPSPPPAQPQFREPSPPRQPSPPPAPVVEREPSPPPAADMFQRPISQPPAPADPVEAPQRPVSRGPRYRALYDYAAADDDEVSFQEGDIIENGEPIDEGWMTGRVQRTGRHGMIPSNYVERF